MIPKVIHYCWFGRNPLPPFAVKCIESWKKFLPGYEIKEWNEDNFDVNIIPYTQEAYEARKYAFVSDYARFYILYHHGGIYFDTDVEVIKSIDDIIERGAFMGCENEAKPGATALAVAPGLGLGCNPGLGLGCNPGLGLGCNPGLGLGCNPGLGLGCNPGLGLGCNPGLGLYAEILGLYAGLHFLRSNGGLNLKTVVEYTTELLSAKGLKNVNEMQCVADVWIYPKEYFCPVNYQTNEMNITDNTRSIHHYAASWHGTRQILFKLVSKIVGKDVAHKISAIVKSFNLIK